MTISLNLPKPPEGIDKELQDYLDSFEREVVRAFGEVPTPQGAEVFSVQAEPGANEEVLFRIPQGSKPKWLVVNPNGDGRESISLGAGVYLAQFHGTRVLSQSGRDWYVGIMVGEVTMSDARGRQDGNIATDDFAQIIGASAALNLPRGGSLSVSATITVGTEQQPLEIGVGALTLVRLPTPATP